MTTPGSVIICSAAGDNPGAPVSGFLLETKAGAIAAGIQRRLAETGAEAAYIYIPEAYTRGTGVEKITGLAADTGGIIRVKTGSDSPVCMDKTALISALEGNYIMPFPIEDEGDLFFEGRPVAELFSVQDAACYGEGETGKVFFVHGAVQKPGFVEAPYGTLLKEIIGKAGGFRGEAKAILLGGVQGKFFKPRDAESLTAEKEDPLFSGSIEVFDRGSCGAEIVRQNFTLRREVSCGKCTLCREGTYQLQAACNDITRGRAKPGVLQELSAMASVIKAGAFCQFGRAVGEGILSAIEVFGEEIEDHVKRRKCPAGTCAAFLDFVILPDKCTGCTKCLDACDDDAIQGKKGFIHIISESDCVKCGKCAAVCEAKAIVTVSGVKPRLPKRLVKAGTF